MVGTTRKFPTSSGFEAERLGIEVGVAVLFGFGVAPGVQAVPAAMHRPDVFDG
jgi:hypothetical protein